MPTWAVHGTSLSVLRQEATPWDGDADVGFLAEDHAELNEMWNATNMARYVATIPECAGMKADFLNEPHFKGFHGIRGAGSFQLDMWDFKLNLDSFDEARTRREWKDKLQLKDNEAILCKWICVRKSDIFPLKPCHISVPLPDKDKPFGQVTRVERVGITCGNRLNEAWAEHYPPYVNWNKTSPYNAFNAETKSWEFDLDVWRSFKAGKGDRFVYDSEQRAGSTHVRDLLEGPVIITPPSEVTVPVYSTFETDSFGGTVLAEVPISAAPPQKADLKPAKTAPVVAAPAGQGSQAEEAELRKYLVRWHALCCTAVCLSWSEVVTLQVRVPPLALALTLVLWWCRRMRRRSITEGKGGLGSSSRAAGC